MTQPEPQPSIPDFRPPSRAPLFGAAGAGLVIGALATAGIMSATRPSPKKHAAPPPPHPSASVAPPASVSAAPSASAAPGVLPGPKPGSLAAEAEKGDPDAVKTLEARPASERTAEESVALSHARAVAKRKAIAEMLHKIELVPKLAKDSTTLKQLREWADDGEVAADLALGIGRLPGSIGPDLLWELGPGYYRKAEIRDIADDVLISKDVRAKASPALGALVDLRAIDDTGKCEDVKKDVGKVKDAGDRRAIAELAKLQNKFGCGPKKSDDCWPCLRDGSDLKDAIKEAAKRRGP